MRLMNSSLLPSLPSFPTHLSPLPRYDHMERLTAQEAMAHPYFAQVREAELKMKVSTATPPTASSSATG